MPDWPLGISGLSPGISDTADTSELDSSVESKDVEQETKSAAESKRTATADIPHFIASLIECLGENFAECFVECFIIVLHSKFLTIMYGANLKRTLKNAFSFIIISTMRLLIIEDEKGLSDAVSHMLKARGWLVSACYDGLGGLEEAQTGLYDLIILDVMLPKMNGFTILEKLRSEGFSSPILMLTAKADLESRIKGLNGGADYYLPKPFEMEELLACVNALARRKDTSIESKDPCFGDLVLRPSLGELSNADTGKSVKLSAREINLAELLMKANGRIISKEQIADKLWGLESDAEYNSAEVYISFLRKKIGFIGSRMSIKASRGMGYYMEEPR